MATTIKEQMIPLSTMILLLLMCSCTSVQANFSIVPTDVTQAEGLNAFFSCRHDMADAYKWSVDNVSVININSPDIAQSFLLANDSGPRISQLMITALSQYNGSNIECVVFTTDNGRQTFPVVTLTVQGRLDAVSNMEINTPSSLLSGDIVSVSWMAPFTLDITDTDPDITYCVDIFSTTDWSHVFSTCGIIETTYNVSLDNVSGMTCDNFNITVTPVNGAGNGTTSGGVFETLGAVTIVGVDLATPQCQRMNVTTQTDYEVEFQVIIEGSVSTCNCQIEIDSSVFDDSNGLNCMSSTLTLTTNTSRLPLANFYDLTVSLSNTVGSISTTMEINTSIIESIQVDDSSSNNAVQLTATFSDDTCLNSADVFVILASLSDTSISINRSVYSVVQVSRTEPSTIEDVPPGEYAALVYDIGSDGLLRNSPITPIATEMMVNVTGSTFNSTISLPSNTTISLVIQQNNDTLNITCEYQQDSISQGCLVIVQLVGSLEEFALLNVKAMPRSEGNQILVSLDREGDYMVTGYSTMNRGIIGASIAHAETVSVEFVFPTAGPTESTMTDDDSEETTSTDESGTPTPTDKYGPGRNIIIGVVVAVVAVLIVLIIVIILIIFIIANCGRKKFEIRKLDFTNSDQESTIRRPLCDADSPTQPDNGNIASDGGGIEMNNIDVMADGEETEETAMIAITQAPPHYKDVIDPMYDSVTSPKPKTATKPNGVSPEDLAAYDPKYDSVGPATNNTSTSTLPSSTAAAAVDTSAVQESSVDEREDDHDPPKIELDRLDRGLVVTGGSERHHPSIEAEETIQHRSGPYTGEAYAVVDKTRKTNNDTFNTDENSIQHIAGPDTGEPYAVVDKTKKTSNESEDNTIQHISGPDTGEPYAVVDKSKKPKTEEKPIQHVQGPATGEMYACVDKLPKRPSYGKRPPPPPPPTESSSTTVPPPLPQRNDARSAPVAPAKDDDDGDSVPSHPAEDVDHVYDSLVSPPPNTKTKKISSSTNPYESVSLVQGQDDQRKESNHFEYKEIDVQQLEKTTESSMNSTVLPGQPDHSLISREENDDSVPTELESNTMVTNNSGRDSRHGSTRRHVAESASLTSPLSRTTSSHSGDPTTTESSGSSLPHPIPAKVDYGGSTEEEGQFLYTVV